MADDTALRLSIVLEGAPPDAQVIGATYVAALDEPYVLTVDVAHAETQHDPATLVGRTCTVRAQRASELETFSGVVFEVDEWVDPASREPRTRLVVAPALLSARLRVDSRIFQDVTSLSILEAVLTPVLAAHGRELEVRCQRAYPAREYVVQYRESDLDFAARVMEEEGIVYFFEHEGERERLVLADHASQHPAFESEHGDVLPYVHQAHDETRGVHARRASRVLQAVGDGVELRAFDWTHPDVPLVARVGEVGDGRLDEYVHEMPMTFHGWEGNAWSAHDLEVRARLARERQARDRLALRVETTALGAHAGRVLELEGHPDTELDGRYVVSRTRHRLGSHVREARAGGRHESDCELHPLDVPWRPASRRARPCIPGIQTATVVGPAGEEIHTDPHGRVKVQLHWDRHGQRDERASCWLRVVQAMGGGGWGFSFIPRIGMEVVVAFVDGDPDLPVVRGVVYNAENPPPYEFPADKTRTTIKTRSSVGSDGYHELRFEDRAGEEEIYLRCQRDWSTWVKNDLTRRTDRDEKQEVRRDRARTVKGNETIVVHDDRVKRVDVDESELVEGDRVREVAVDERSEVNANRTKVVRGDESVTIAGQVGVTVGGDVQKQVGGNLTQTFASNQAMAFQAGQTHQVAGSKSVSVVSNVSSQTAQSAAQKVGGGLLDKVSGAVNERTGTSWFRNVKLVENLNLGQRSITVTAADAVLNATETHTVRGVFELRCTTLNHTVAGPMATTVIAGPYVVIAKTAAMDAGAWKAVGATEHERGSVELKKDAATMTGSQGVILGASGAMKIVGKSAVKVDGGGGAVHLKGSTIQVNA